MRAIVYDQFGGPEVLRMAEVPTPEPGERQVRVEVRAAAVNPFDWKVRRGLMAPGLPREFPATPGYDVAGVVDRVGAGVTGLAVGDEVLGSSTTGAYAEYALAEPESLVAKPPSVDWIVAGGFGSVAQTANRVLTELGVAGGHTVLINGAAGGVGQLAVQLARRLGADVVGTASPANHEHLRALGATPVSYGDGLADRVRTTAADGVDYAFDVAGHGDLGVLIELTGSAERVITIADPSAQEHGVRFSSGQGADESSALAGLTGLLAAGELNLAVQEVYPLADAAQAQRQSEAGHAWGRLILTPS